MEICPEPIDTGAVSGCLDSVRLQLLRGSLALPHNKCDLAEDAAFSDSSP
jgi:hypothetical protein